MITRTLRVAGGFVALVRTGLIVGLAVAALIYPMAALTGVGAKKGADALAIPVDALRTSLPAQTTHVFVQLEQRVGADSAVRMAERLGLRWRTGIDKLQASQAKAKTWGAFTLGVADTTPLEMAGAFATVVADGVKCDPIPVTSITDPSGAQAVDAKGVPVARPRCAQVLSADVARGAVDAARCVTGYRAATGDCGGGGTASRVYPTVRRPVAGKSGTTDDNRAAWFVGMTPGLTIAGFIADPDNPLHRVGSGNAGKPRETVADTLREALAGTPIRNFYPDPSHYRQGRKAPQTRPRH